MTAMADETLDTIVAALNTNADYLTDNSITKAKAFRDALMRASLLRPSALSDMGSSLAFDSVSIQTRLDEVNAFIRSASGNRRSRITTTRGWRK